MKKQHPHIDKIFKAIADPTRRSIFHALVVAGAAMPITEIAERFEMSRQGVTKHIKTLEAARLLSINQQGRERYCTAIPQSLKSISEWLRHYDQFWEDSLDRLDKHLGESE